MTITKFPSVCICGCDHVKSWIEDNTLQAEVWSCDCPAWVRHVITTPGSPKVCAGTLRNGDPCPRPPEPNRTFCEAHALAIKWKFDPQRAQEYEGHNEWATIKQKAYIQSLAAQKPRTALELEAVVNAFNSPSYQYGLLGSTKGEAIYIIRCFLDEIKPSAIDKSA